MTYRAAPVTQRDGSSLASSNCRMASIATGLDYHTLGAKTSTGSKMRSHQDDQSGGTGSDDAEQAWADGYSQDLRVMDGHTWADALDDLRAGRLVHLDVWHQTAGGPCLSGSGAYGHTMAVAPEQHSDGRWLVADPWCSPGKWVWWSESKLKAGAESWGGQVYSAALMESDYPSGGPAPTDPRVLVIVWRIARRLMSKWYPGHERPDDEPPLPDTGGGGSILYTTTKAQATEGATMSGLLFLVDRWRVPAGADFFDDYACKNRVGEMSSDQEVTSIGAACTTQDADGVYWGSRLVLIHTKAVDGTTSHKAFWMKRADGYPLSDDRVVPSDPEWDESAWRLLHTLNAVYPGTSAPPDDLASRQAQWDADSAALVEVLGPRPT